MVELISKPTSAKTGVRVGVAVALLAVILTGWAAARHLAMGGLSENEVAVGEAAVARALEDEEGAWEEANEAFIDAASVSIFDHYPAFCLSVTRRLEAIDSGEDPGGERAGDPVLRALVRSDWELARSEVDEMREASPEKARYFDRFVEAVRQESMKRE